MFAALSLAFSAAARPPGGAHSGFPGTSETVFSSFSVQGIGGGASAAVSLQPGVASAFSRPPYRFAVKTNAALWGATVANIGAEFGFGRHCSVDLPVILSPYAVKKDYRLQVYGLQPEFRYWLKEPMTGHFFGLHAHLAWFDVALDDKDRYQDAGGNSPLWGIGLSYGYALPFSRRWGAEFTVGAGYARIHYDTFYNIPNGARFSTGTKNYWGITRLGITLVYKLKPWNAK